MFYPINCLNIYPNMYEINTEGVVRNIATKHELSTIITAGYPSVFLKTIDNKRTAFYKHRIMGIMFVNNPDPLKYDCIHHKDANKLNCSLDNLMWVTKGQNNALGRSEAYKPNPELSKWGQSNTVGTRNGMNKHSEETIRSICESLVKGCSHRQSAINAGLVDNENNRLLVTSIANKKRWKCISDEYF